MSELFRKEVIDARRTRWIGGVSLVQPVRIWILTAFAVLAALCVALFLMLATYTRRASVAGRLVPTKGLAIVLAPATGVVGRVDAVEGDRVAAGQLLAVVVVPRTVEGSGDSQASLAARLEERRDGLSLGRDAQQQRFDAQFAGLKARLTSARSELAQIQVEIATREDQARIARETLQQLRQLREGSFVSLLQIKQQESVALEHVGQVQGLQRQVLATRRAIGELEQALSELPSQRAAARADFSREAARLGQEMIETRVRGALVLNAPVEGVIATQLVKAGQAVEVGQPLMSLLPGDGALEAELLVPSRSIGFIQAGDRVMLRYQAYPYQKFGHQPGRVVQVARAASAAPTDARAEGRQPAEPLYRVTVALARQHVDAYGQTEALKPGMLLDADILGERRRLIEWLFEPLYSIKGTVGAD